MALRHSPENKGEWLERLLKAKSMPESPSGYDILLFISYAVEKILTENRPPDIRFELQRGKYYFGTTSDDKQTVYYVEHQFGETLFYATREGNQVTIHVFKPGEWRELMEHMYNKVRTCMDSPERWIAEYPHMGLLTVNT